MHSFPYPHSRLRLLSGLSLLIAAVLLFSCQTPLEPGNNYTNPTSMEFESVWQYCKAWSIYQDSSIYAGVLPANPFAFSSPSDIMAAIHDTLKGNLYTEYDIQDGQNTFYNWSDASISPVADVAYASASPTMPYDSTITFDTLTNATALLTISTFEAPVDGQVYNDFLYCAPALSGFKNIIVDLRENLGGYIDEAQNIIQSMIPDTTAYIQARQRDFIANHYVTLGWHDWYTAQSPAPLLSGKHYAVIMDGWTASAAELTVAALYEGQKTEWKSTGDGAWLLGSRSYGKGIGQVLIERRGSCYNSFTGLDTIYNANQDSMEIVPFVSNDFLDLKITFLQLRGVSARIGNYHRIGITPDAVPAAVTQQVDTLFPITSGEDTTVDTGSSYYRPIYYAVKLLEPGMNMDSLVRDTLGAPVGRKIASAVQKRVVRNPRSVARAVEKVIRTDKILPSK